MIYLPVSQLLFLLLLLLLPFIGLSLTFDVVRVAAAKLGFPPNVGLILLVLIVLGGAINIPLYRVKSDADPLEDVLEIYRRQFWGIPFHKVQQTTIVAVNLGGGAIPVLLAIYQFRHADAIPITLATAIVTTVSYFAAQVVPGIGVQMNPLLAPLTASVCATLFARSHIPAVAFASGVLGTLIGADLLHLKHIQRISTGVLSIGGAGVFDGIALCGLFALLLS
jgi:uncharacterized membrane protein